MRNIYGMPIDILDFLLVLRQNREIFDGQSVRDISAV